MEGERSHHCANPAPLNDSLNLNTSPPHVFGGQPDVERNETVDENPFAEVPGSSLEFPSVGTPQSIFFVWGQSEERVITVSSSEIINAYNFLAQKTPS